MYSGQRPEEGYAGKCSIYDICLRYKVYQRVNLNMDNIILEFLEVYKCLDELCKQVLSSDRGISVYIDEMNQESQACMVVACWREDYKQLKKMRWIRNKLVHEPNSFQEISIGIEDIEWLKNFRSRILKGADSLSLLYQSRSIKGKNIENKEYSEDLSKTDDLSFIWKLSGVIVILIVIIILAFAFYFLGGLI